MSLSLKEKKKDDTTLFITSVGKYRRGGIIALSIKGRKALSIFLRKIEGRGASL